MYLSQHHEQAASAAEVQAQALSFLVRVYFIPVYIVKVNQEVVPFTVDVGTWQKVASLWGSAKQWEAADAVFGCVVLIIHMFQLPTLLAGSYAYFL